MPTCRRSEMLYDRPMMLRIGPALVLALALSGCGRSGPAPATERLWVSALPKDARASFTAFVTIRAGDQRYYGSFYHGSLLRGGHDAFRWEPIDNNGDNNGDNSGDDRGDGRGARLTFLHDGHERNLRLSRCEPSDGFDLCVEVRGGPYGVERYQSRKRWVVGRKAKPPQALEVARVVADLADQDPDLAAALAH